jgi:hypothetical protein
MSEGAHPCRVLCDRVGILTLTLTLILILTLRGRS